MICDDVTLRNENILSVGRSRVSEIVVWVRETFKNAIILSGKGVKSYLISFFAMFLIKIFN